jgi:hypothetical protein
VSDLGPITRRAFGGQQREGRARPCADAFGAAPQHCARIHVDADRCGLVRPDPGEIGFLGNHVNRDQRIDRPSVLFLERFVSSDLAGDLRSHGHHICPKAGVVSARVNRAVLPPGKKAGPGDDHRPGYNKGLELTLSRGAISASVPHLGPVRPRYVAPDRDAFGRARHSLPYRGGVCLNS